jgi:hypothetical protein
MADFTDGAPEGVDGPDGAARRRAFNFAKAISIGLRSGLLGGRNKSQASVARTPCGGGAVMGRQIVQDYDVFRPTRRSQLSLDVSFQKCAGPSACQ